MTVFMTFILLLTYNKYLQFLQRQNMEKQAILSKEDRKKEEDRYRKYLTISSNWENKDKFYPELDKTLALLQQIFQLSLTKEGRARIHQIQSLIIEYYLIEAVKTQWTRSYGKIDNYCLRIIANLAKDPLFYQSAISVKQTICTSNARVYSANFNRVAAQAIKQINNAIEGLKQQERQKIKQNGGKMRFKDDQLYFMGFSGSWKFYQFYCDYIQALIELMREDKKDFVKHQFPKGCFGCIVFSIIVSSNRAKQKEIGIRFLKQLTNGWFTVELYEILLSQIYSLYRNQLNFNYDLRDPYEITCNRFWISRTRYNNIFNYLSKIGRFQKEEKLHLLKKVHSKYDFQDEMQQFKAQQRKEAREQEFEKKMQRTCRTIIRNPKDEKLFGVSQIVQGALKAEIAEQLNNVLIAHGQNYKSVQLKYIHEQQAKLVKIRDFLSRNSFFLAKCQDGSLVYGLIYNEYSKQKFLRIGTFPKKTLYELSNIDYSIQLDNTNKQFLPKSIEGEKKKQQFFENLPKRERVSFKIGSEQFYFKPNWKKEFEEAKTGWNELLQGFPQNTVSQKLILFKCSKFELYEVYFKN